LTAPQTEQDVLRLLVIDSDSVRRGMVACTLPSDRYRIDFAGSAEMGLDLLSVLRPQIVIVGQECAPADICQRIRAMPAGYSCRLVLMDERYLDEVAGETEAEAAGADTFLPFPFDRRVFERLVDADPYEAESPPAPSPRLHQATQRIESVAIKDEHAKDSIANPAGSWETFKNKVTTIHRHLASLNYYQILQVSESATGDGIKNAYFDCAMQFHPDRFMNLSDPEFKSQIYEIYKRMSEAFKVLIDPVTRRYYDTKLNAPIQEDEEGENLRYQDLERKISKPDDLTSDAQTAAGKRYLHFAIVAEDQDRMRSAYTYLSLVLQHEPKNEALQERLDQVSKRLKG